MDVMSLENKSLHSLLEQLKNDFPGVSWREAARFSWDPKERVISYASHGEHPKWSLLHEAGHMNKGHNNYKNDIGLLMMEVEAWTEAKSLGAKYGEVIDQTHIEDCLDSYRDWLHKRSQCPKCEQNGLEYTRGHYRCINCHHEWSVSDQRFCRVYRKSKTPS